jgi:hypothetical protein
MIQLRGSRLLPTRENARRPPTQAVLHVTKWLSRTCAYLVHLLAGCQAQPYRTNAIGRSESVCQKRSNQLRRGVFGWKNMDNVCRICHRQAATLELPKQANALPKHVVFARLGSEVHGSIGPLGGRRRSLKLRKAETPPSMMLEATAGQMATAPWRPTPTCHATSPSQPVGMETFLD